MPAILSWIALLIALATSTGLLLVRDWRWSLGLLAAQYLGIFLLVQVHWPIAMAATKLVAGWMACAMLGIAHLTGSEAGETETTWFQGQLFQLFATGMVVAVTFAIALQAAHWLGLSLPVSWGGVLLIGTGLLHLGITARPFQVVLGLLTVLAGFEVLYASVETSTLVAALMVVVNLGLALAGAYFLTPGPREEIP